MPHEDAPAEASVIMAIVLTGFGFPMTVASASFAFGSLEHVGEGFLVALAVWVLGIGASFLQPFRPAVGETDVPPALRWGLIAIATAALAAVVASSAPLLPWTLTILVGPFFAWIAGSLYLMSREARDPARDIAAP